MRARLLIKKLKKFAELVKDSQLSGVYGGLMALVGQGTDPRYGEDRPFVDQSREGGTRELRPGGREGRGRRGGGRQKKGGEIAARDENRGAGPQG